MKVNNKKMCVVFVLVMLEISSLFLMYKSNSNKEIKLDNVENKIEDNNLFALMVEQTLGTYTTSSSTTWPTGYVLNTLKSGCVDNKGNKIENGMKYDKANNKVIIDTDKTSNCYVYLSKSTFARVIASTQVWNSDLLNDGYRYFGIQDETASTMNNVPNYVCFGTQSKSECISDTDKYMYRIIGMFQEDNGNGTINTNSDYHLKLIKKEALNTKYQWHSDKTTDTSWSQSDLYKGINGTYFLTNRDYSYMQNNFWYSKITNWKWISSKTNQQTGTGLDYFYDTVTNIYLDEMNRSTRPNESVSTYDISSAKIGLMYVSDYLLSSGNIAKEYTGVESELKKGWMHLTNNDSIYLNSNSQSAPSLYDWTISRYGYSNTTYTAYRIHNSGEIDDKEPTTLLSVRPTFYLNSDVVICSGSGTSTDPYILG